jgi:ribonucleoside-diphosphate reductase alpha chain
MSMAEGHTRRLVPVDRTGITTKLEVSSDLGVAEGYIIANVFPDGSLAELFLTGFGKEGSTLDGWVQVCAVLFSVGIQSGVEFAMIARKIARTRFEPYGLTSDPDIPWCSSIPHYVVRWLSLRFGSKPLQDDLAQISVEMRGDADPRKVAAPLEILCRSCSGLMRRMEQTWRCTCGAEIPA